MIARLFAGRAAAWLAAALCALFAASAAEAQAVRYVRTNGVDTNPCTLAAPCKTLARGIQAAPARGEVRLLNSGNFGAGVTIGKSLTVSGNGNTLILSGADAITVDNAAANVVLRGLLLNGLGTVSDGILVLAAASVHIAGCEIERFTEEGIEVQAGAAETFVTDTISRNNGINGMGVAGDGSTRVTLDKARFENNGVRGAVIVQAQTSVTHSEFSGNGSAGSGNGLFVSGGVATVAWSKAASNAANGFVIAGAEMQLESSVVRGHPGASIFNNNAAGSLSISNMTVTDNGTGISNFGTLATRGNNRVFGNDTDFSGNAPTPLGGT